MLFHYKSIRLKFLAAVAATSIVTLLVTIIFMGIYDWNDYKNRWVNDLGNQAVLLGRASIPALEFDDPQAAAKNLQLLEVRPRVNSAALYDSKGNIYAVYNSDQYSSKLNASLKNDTVQVNGDEILIARRIEQNSNLIGYMVIKAQYGLYKRLFSYLGILIMVGTLAFIISQLIARWLQQQITKPIEAIAELSKKVVEQRNYSFRATKTTDDEVGYLVTAFNTMLKEVELSNQAQEKALADLAQENEVRKNAEQRLQEAHDELEQRVQERTLELKKAQHALLQSQKLEAVGQLTGGVAHDFNNILQVIGSNLEILMLKFANVGTAQQRIQSALSAVDKGARLASHLLAFARRQPLQPVPTNLNNLTQSMDDLLRRALGEGIKLEVIQGGGLWNVMVDRNQIENVILNLSINARDAMDGNGHLTIETSNVMLDDLYAENHAGLSTGQHVMLAISDTGCGMSSEVVERAFEPFFTTKTEGKGTGLGLSMAYGVVKQSEGHIKIYSEPGHGTTIKIYFPRIHLPEAEQSVKKLTDIQGGTESILVVEDDIAVQTAVADILIGLGYHVQTASDAQSALDIIEKGQKFDLLFTDVVMPGPLKSSEMAKIAKNKLPNIAVLFTSGYTQNAIVHGGKLDAGVELINKPYRQADLARKIRMVIDKTHKESSEKNPIINEEISMDEVSDETAITNTVENNAAKPIKILVVEDNEEAQLTLCELLSMLGYYAEGVTTGEDALDMLADFDILLTDMNLPGMSGIELAQKCYSLDANKPIIISSGMDISTQLQFEVQLLPKPFSIAILSEVLEKSKKSFNIES
ncbi:MAG TPA: response regulator [Methylotenera sp.]|nr:response regulator [Methylotenera sp.]